ncbi:MAG TPA: lysophospholipid acyltransferase family protein [Thermoanaerobaculia bacterium]|nr:lysophospholipid acyltransferase family protein [Thermoanaerobaculia bacterium]
MTEPARPAIVARLVQETFGLWFGVFRWMAKTLPTEWVARLAAATAERAIWERESVRDAILENVGTVLGLPAADRRVEETGRAMISNHSRLWIDLLRWSSRPDADPAALAARRTGEERLLAARDAGRGAILLTAHVGNFELGGLFLRALGLSAAVAYVPDPSPVVERHRADARAALGLAGVPVTSSPLAFVPLLRALREGRFVAMQGDRDVSGTGRPLPFFGRPVPFPVGPFHLAAVSGAPVLPVFILMEPDGRYRVTVEAPLRLGLAAGSRTDPDDGQLLAALTAWVSILERVIRENPDQWYLFTRFPEAGSPPSL